MDTLSKNLARLTKLTQREVEPVLRFFQPVKISAKAILLEPGSICSAAWFVGTGILRAYSVVEERKRISTCDIEEKATREISNWIVSEGGFITDVRSFLHQTPATCFVEGLETSKLYKLTYDNYLIIQESFPIIFRLIFESTLIMADLRVQMCTMRNSIDRLHMFEQMYPRMTGRLSVNILATFLNIDPTTLSKIRGKIR